MVNHQATDSATGLGQKTPLDQALAAPPVQVALVLAGAGDADEHMASDVDACPSCQRRDAIVRLGDLLFCAACGFSSEGGRGCT